LHVPHLAARTALRLVALALSLSVCLPAPALAQRPRPDRPYRGLFGGNGADPNSTQQLDVNVSLFGAYDDNVLASQSQGGIDPRYQQSGGYGNSTLSLDYTKRVGRASFDFTGGTSYRYYPSIKELNGFSYFASIGFSAKLGARTTLNATESGSYMPYFAFSPFAGVTPSDPGIVAPITPQQALVNQAATMLSSSAALEHRVTPRNTLSADYSFTYADYQSLVNPYQTWAVGGQYRYRLTPRATLKLGYHFRRGTLGFYNTLNEPVDSHDLDIGVDYSRPLSQSRKTTVGFSTGSTIYRSVNTPVVPPTSPPSSADLYLRTRYMVTGSAFISREIGRSWQARADYRRGLQMVQGFGAPFFADSVNLSLTGFVNSRSRLSLSAAYSNGDVGITINTQRYTTAVATANYQVAVNRWAALFAQYDFYHYLFDPTIVLPPGMGRGLSRNGARVGLNLWLPLLR
jgi:hypothetical protein